MSRRILLIEDSPVVAPYTVDVLTELGFTVVGTAPNMASARDLIDSRRRWVQQWQRGGEDRWIVTLPLTGRATFDSPTLAGVIELDRLYRNTGLDAPDAAT